MDRKLDSYSISLFSASSKKPFGWSDVLDNIFQNGCPEIVSVLFYLESRWGFNVGSNFNYQTVFRPLRDGMSSLLMNILPISSA